MRTSKWSFVRRVFFISFCLFVDPAWSTELPVVPGGKLGPFQHGTYPSLGDRTHAGVDILAPCGAPVYPLAEGTVVDSIIGPSDPHFGHLGYMAIVEHPRTLIGREFYTIYLHLEEPPAVLHGPIKKNQQLGKVGNTGRTDGTCHVHFEVRYFKDRFSPVWRNIYGPGDQRNSIHFQSAWEDPLSVIARLSGGQQELAQEVIEEKLRKQTPDTKGPAVATTRHSSSVPGAITFENRASVLIHILWVLPWGEAPEAVLAPGMSHAVHTADRPLRVRELGTGREIISLAADSPSQVIVITDEAVKQKEAALKHVEGGVAQATPQQGVSGDPRTAGGPQQGQTTRPISGSAPGGTQGVTKTTATVGISDSDVVTFAGFSDRSNWRCFKEIRIELNHSTILKRFDMGDDNTARQVLEAARAYAVERCPNATSVNASINLQPADIWRDPKRDSGYCCWIYGKFRQVGVKWEWSDYRNDIAAQRAAAEEMRKQQAEARARQLAEEARRQATKQARQEAEARAQEAMAAKTSPACNRRPPVHGRGGTPIPEPVRDIVTANPIFAQPVVAWIPPEGDAIRPSERYPFLPAVILGEDEIAHTFQRLLQLGLAAFTTRDELFGEKIPTVTNWYAKAIRDCIQFKGRYALGQLEVGRRRLVEVIYYNKFRKVVSGVELDVHGLRFRYTIEPTIDATLIPAGTFEGQMQVFRDPADGFWKVLDASLPK